MNTDHLKYLPALFFILTSVLLNVCGQISLKFGVRSLGDIHLSWHSLLQIFSNLNILGGLFFYGLSFIFWVLALSKSDLSYAYPFLSLGYILILIVSYFLFQEQITAVRIAGVLLVVFGLLLIART